MNIGLTPVFVYIHAHSTVAHEGRKFRSHRISHARNLISGSDVYRVKEVTLPVSYLLVSLTSLEQFFVMEWKAGRK